MRRASSKLISNLHHHSPKHLITTLPPLPNPTPIPSNPTNQSQFQTHLKPTKKIQFLHNLSRNFNTIVENSPVLPSRQRKIKEKLDLEEAFESAETADDMLKAFKDMEASFEEKELGLASLKMGLKLDQEGEDPEKTLDFGLRALSVLDKDGKISLLLAMNLQLLGSVCYSLKRFNESLGYLNRANRILGQLENDDSLNIEDVMPIMHAVQLELFNVKTAVGRREEALAHLRKSLEIKEMTLDENSKELGNANRDVAEAYVAVLNFKEALPFCLKAVEIHKTDLGSNSVEVAHDRRLLGIIYTGLEEHEKALEQNQLSQRVLKSWGLSTDVLRAEIDAANMQIALGRYEEAINTLKSVVQLTDKESEDRAMIFIAMAKALCNQEKFIDAKRCLEISYKIYDKKETKTPVAVAEAFMEIAMQYESMNEFENAISLLKRALSMLEKIPQEQHSVGSVSARVGWLLLLTGKVEQAIPYLEDATERLKESFGSNHFGIGYVYNNLGAAYLELDRPQSAAQVFAYAKDIMEVSLGPHHADTIGAFQNLSKAYAAMGSYDLAINFQNKVIEAWEDHGPSAEDELEEAQRLLEELKNKAREEMAKSLLKAMPVGANDGSVLYEDSQIRVPVIENKAREQISNSLLKALPRSPNDASVPDEDFQVRVSSH